MATGYVLLLEKFSVHPEPPFIYAAKMRSRFVSFIVIVMALFVLSVPQSGPSQASVKGDGPAPCSVGNPPAPYGGMCATYGGVNTWFGAYGPGFPSATGWGFCADAPSTVHGYPYPGYQYKAASAPPGTALGEMNPLGYAFSQFSALGYWNGVKGSFTKDEAFVAADLLYEARAWATPLPSMPTGVERAYQALANFYNAAVGASANPTITLVQQGGGSSFVDATTLVATVTFPGTNRGITGLSVTLKLTNAVADATGTSSVTQTTAKNGSILVPISATGPGPLTVSATASVAIGKRGMGFFGPTAEILTAQVIAGPNAPTTIQQSANFTSQGPAMVAQSFAKTASGNIDPGHMSLAGAVMELRTSSGFLAATCTTSSAGTCTTPASLIEGTLYRWTEVVAPPGLAAGATGTFTASQNSATITIALNDPGEMIIVQADKVDTQQPNVRVPGATFDLYRMDDGVGPNHPTAPSGAVSEPGGTWVARAEAGAQPADFGWQYPNYAYCVREVSAPPGYALAPTMTCSDVTAGTTASPPTLVTISVADAEATTTLYVEKSNVQEPGQGVPGATYDLYVKTPGPLSTPTQAPHDAALEPSMQWYERGTTSRSGHLGFTVPVGYSWCILEHQAPADFQLDPGLHCTARIDHGSPDPVRTIAVSERPIDITLQAFKFNAHAPGEGIPNATYALFVNGTFPDGYRPVPPPEGVSVPAGMHFFASATTSTSGVLAFRLPAGHAWCLQELIVPSGYQLDTGLHCSGVIWKNESRPTNIALPEVPALPDTGAPMAFAGCLGALLVALGLLTLQLSRRRS